MIDEVAVRCPFCDGLFLMQRPLFFSERERTACPSCRAKAIENTRKGREELSKAKRVRANVDALREAFLN